MLLFSCRWILPESPRWLLAVGRTQEVYTILEKAARFNNRKLPKNFDKLLQQEVIEEECGENVTVLDLFKTPQMRRKTLSLFLIWFSVYLVYYGVVLNLANIGGNLYVNSVSSNYRFIVIFLRTFFFSGRYDTFYKIKI